MIAKGLSEDVADLIGTYVQLSGSEELVSKLEDDSKLMSIEDARIGVEEMKTLYQYCNAMGVTGKVILCFIALAYCDFSCHLISV